MMFTTSAFEIAQRYVGMKEIPGTKDNPAILAMLRLDAQWPEGDETPWCSAFSNMICWLLHLPRSKSLAARSWMDVGRPIELHEATPGFDVVILSRGSNPAHGHVGFFAGSSPEGVFILGGNQSNAVSIRRFDTNRVIGVRRLWPPTPTLPGVPA